MVSILLQLTDVQDLEPLRGFSGEGRRRMLLEGSSDVKCKVSHFPSLQVYGISMNEISFDTSWPLG